MDTTSLWETLSTRSEHYPPLASNIEVDVAIIGGGITGVTTANQLIRAGKKVAILESALIGSGTTGNSTGNLYIAVQPFYQHIVAKFDLETATAIAQSRHAGIDYIENTIYEKKISCNFSRRPWYAYTAKDPRISLDKEVELFKKMQVPVAYIDDLPLAFKFKKAILMENQARFNPLQYTISLAADLAKNKCHIYENTRVTDITETDHCVLTTAHGKVTAKKVVIATHTPIGINPTQLFTAPYRSYVVAVELQDKQYPEGHFWDLDRPPHATCTHAISANNEPALLMVAGSHHKTGQGDDMRTHYREMESFLREHFPVSKVSHRWSAQHYQAADNVPYIGLAHRGAKHTYLATGYFADGLLYGTIAGIMLADLIIEKQTSLKEIYNAQRFTPVASAGFVSKENTNVFFQYLKDQPIFSKPDYKHIKPGEGQVVEVNREKLAVSRDENNTLHVVSAVCTHMKCIVNWNNAEKTWDCPCHGSRFTCTGKVIEGPAKADLDKKTLQNME